MPAQGKETIDEATPGNATAVVAVVIVVVVGSGDCVCVCVFFLYFPPPPALTSKEGFQRLFLHGSTGHCAPKALLFRQIKAERHSERLKDFLLFMIFF